MGYQTMEPTHLCMISIQLFTCVCKFGHCKKNIHITQPNFNRYKSLQIVPYYVLQTIQFTTKRTSWWWTWNRVEDFIRKNPLSVNFRKGQNATIKAKKVRTYMSVIKILANFLTMFVWFSEKAFKKEEDKTLTSFSNGSSCEYFINMKQVTTYICTYLFT